MKEKIIKLIEEKQTLIRKLMYFNLDQMDKLPEFNDYYHKEYLINYYENHLLNDLLNEIDKLGEDNE